MSVICGKGVVQSNRPIQSEMPPSMPANAVPSSNHMGYARGRGDGIPSHAHMSPASSDFPTSQPPSLERLSSMEFRDDRRRQSRHQTPNRQKNGERRRNTVGDPPSSKPENDLDGSNNSDKSDKVLMDGSKASNRHAQHPPRQPSKKNSIRRRSSEDEDDAAAKSREMRPEPDGRMNRVEHRSSRDVAAEREAGKNRARSKSKGSSRSFRSNESHAHRGDKHAQLRQNSGGSGSGSGSFRCSEDPPDNLEEKIAKHRSKKDKSKTEFHRSNSMVSGPTSNQKSRMQYEKRRMSLPENPDIEDRRSLSPNRRFGSPPKEPTSSSSHMDQRPVSCPVENSRHKVNGDSAPPPPFGLNDSSSSDMSDYHAARRDPDRHPSKPQSRSSSFRKETAQISSSESVNSIGNPLSKFGIEPSSPNEKRDIYAPRRKHEVHHQSKPQRSTSYRKEEPKIPSSIPENHPSNAPLNLDLLMSKKSKSKKSAAEDFMSSAASLASVATMDSTARNAEELEQLIQVMQKEFYRILSAKNDAEAKAEKLQTDISLMQQETESQFLTLTTENDQLKRESKEDRIRLDQALEKVDSYEEENKSLKQQMAKLLEDNRVAEARMSSMEEENRTMKKAMKVLAKSRSGPQGSDW